MSHKIPNSLSVSVWLLFLPLAWWVGLTVEQVGMHLLLGLAVMMSSYAFGGFGAGAAKLLGGFAFWIGFDIALAVLVIVACGTMCLGFLALKCFGRPAQVLPFLPYAVLAFAITFPHTHIFALLWGAQA